MTNKWMVNLRSRRVEPIKPHPTRYCADHKAKAYLVSTGKPFENYGKTWVLDDEHVYPTAGAALIVLRAEMFKIYEARKAKNQKLMDSIMLVDAEIIKRKFM